MLLPVLPIGCIISVDGVGSSNTEEWCCCCWSCDKIGAGGESTGDSEAGKLDEDGCGGDGDDADSGGGSAGNGATEESGEEEEAAAAWCLSVSM